MRNSHYNRGRLLRSLGKQEEAVAEYTRAIDLFALPTEYINRANCYTSLNRPDEVLADYAKAIELAPHHASLALYNRGCLYELLKRPADALADYAAAIRSNPNGRDGYVGRAGLYMDAGRYDLAVADCTAALEIDPTHLTAVFNRGASLVAPGAAPGGVAGPEPGGRTEPEAGAGVPEAGGGVPGGRATPRGPRPTCGRRTR